MRTNLHTAEIDRITGLVLTPYPEELESHYYERPGKSWLLCRARLKPNVVERFLSHPYLVRRPDPVGGDERTLFQGARLDLLSHNTIYTTRRFITATVDYMGANTVVLIDLDDPRKPELYLYNRDKQ